MIKQLNWWLIDGGELESSWLSEKLGGERESSNNHHHGSLQ